MEGRALANHPELLFLTCLYGLALLAALAVLGAACISDFRSMTIPNALPLGLAAAFLVAYASSAAINHLGGEDFFAPVQNHLIAFAIIFTLTFALYGLKIWGAGDSKLAAAIALWIGLKGIAPFLLAMSLGGIGLVALGFVIQKIKFNPSWLGEHSWPARLRRGDRVVPYGIPIALGAVAAFAERGYFNIFN